MDGELSPMVPSPKRQRVSQVAHVRREAASTPGYHGCVKHAKRVAFAPVDQTGFEQHLPQHQHVTSAQHIRNRNQHPALKTSANRPGPCICKDSLKKHPMQMRKLAQDSFPSTGLKDTTVFHNPRQLYCFDIVERSNAFELVTDAPGFTPEDISVELKEGVLTISGKHQEQREHQPSDQQTQDQVKVWRRERHVQQFSRSFKLPDNAKPEDISANLDKGVLTVQVPKLPPAPKPEPRRIAVQGAPAVAA